MLHFSSASKIPHGHEILRPRLFSRHPPLSRSGLDTHLYIRHFVILPAEETMLEQWHYTWLDCLNCLRRKIRPTNMWRRSLYSITSFVFLSSADRMIFCLWLWNENYFNCSGIIFFVATSRGSQFLQTVTEHGLISSHGMKSYTAQKHLTGEAETSQTSTMQDCSQRR